MKFPIVLLLLAIVCVLGASQEPAKKPATTSPQPETPKSEVDLELDRVAALYKTGNFEEAQRHAEVAVSLAPANLKAWIFLARVSHQRYRPGVQTPENLEVARAAIDAYQRVLALDPRNEDAYKAIAVLFGAIKDEQSLREWLMRRAVDNQFSNKQRAEAYAQLAGRYWDCSFKLTELPTRKIVDRKKRPATITYLKPEDAREFEEIEQCVSKGLEMAENAIGLDDDSESGWSYKARLLVEKSKISEMQGLTEAKASDRKAAAQADLRARALEGARQKREEAGESEATPSPTPAPTNRL